jgi:hypothetical protein
MKEKYEKSIVVYEGKHIDIVSDGSTAGTYIHIDGEKQEWVTKIVITLDVKDRSTPKVEITRLDV